MGFVLILKKIEINFCIKHHIINHTITMTNSNKRIELIIIEDQPVLYANLTGATINDFLTSIKLLNIQSTYMDYQFTKPKECDKWVYLVSERFQCITSETIVKLDVLEYAGFYHVEIEGYLLKIYDHNVCKKKSTFQILLNNEEIIKLLPRLRRWKSNVY